MTETVETMPDEMKMLQLLLAGCCALDDGDDAVDDDDPPVHLIDQLRSIHLSIHQYRLRRRYLHRLPDLYSLEIK